MVCWLANAVHDYGNATSTPPEYASYCQSSDPLLRTTQRILPTTIYMAVTKTADDYAAVSD
jgi:hypothetical protein